MKNLLPFLITLSTAMIVGVLFAWVQREKLKDEAVEVGVAEYYLDENHDRQWRWITNSTP